MLNLLLSWSLLFLFMSCSTLEQVWNNNKSKDTQKSHQFRARWSRNFDPSYESGNLPISTASPLIHEGILYVTSLDKMIRAFDLDSGRLKWEFNENQVLMTKPVFFNGHIYYGSREGRLFVREAEFGELKFAIDLGAPIEAPVTIAQERLLIHLRNHQLICLDAETGKILWSYTRSVPYLSTLQRVSVPLVLENKVYMGTADGFLIALSLLDGDTLWERKLSDKNKFVDVDVTPLLFKGRLVAGSATGPIHFMTLETGVIARSADIAISHTPRVYDNYLWVGTQFGEVVKLDSEAGIMIRKKITDFSISDLVLWGECLVLATMGQELYCLDPQTLEKKSTFFLGSELSAVFGQLAIESDFLAMMSSRSRLWVFKEGFKN